MVIIKKEIRTHCQLHHRNIIKLHNYEFLEDKVCLILEYAPKGNLFRLLHSKEGKKLTFSQKRKIFA